jgi:tRNA nucleotidyltransferase (CCA-adding enzyme)
MNAIAMSVEGKLVDPYLGSKAIQEGVIECVGIPTDRFDEDKLRKLRAIRFAAQTGFTIEAKTLSAIKKDPNLDGVSAERITEELNKILISDRAKIGFHLLKSTGMLEVIIPELKSTYTFDQRHPMHIWSVFDHSLEVLELLPKEKELRWAALLHDIAKPKCFVLDEEGIGHFYGHEKASAEIASHICNRMKMSSASVRQICHLIKNHMKIPVLTEKAVKRWMKQIGLEAVEDTFIFLLADAKGKGTPVDELYYRNLEKMLVSIQEKPQVFDRSALVINGNELMQVNHKLAKNPKLLNELFEHLVDLCLDQPDLNKKSQLLKLSQEWLEKITEKS